MGFGVSGILGNWIAGHMADRHQFLPTICTAIILMLVMALIALIANLSIGLLVFAIFIWGSAHMAAFVVTQVRIMKAGMQFQSFALSLNLSACNLGISFGSVSGGLIIDQFGIEAIGYFSSAVTAFAAVAAFLMTKKVSSKPTSGIMDTDI